jgi:pimeloyl-ACP methyl ester carboxylesterase
MRLEKTTTGDGPRHIGLVHGLAGDAGTWGPLIDLLTASGEVTVTAVDLRGHGASDRSSSYALADLADDLVENLPTGLHGVVGHSLGGSVLVRAVERLAPRRAIYLDPGFRLPLPTTGLAGRLFWLAPLLTLGIAQARQSRGAAAARAAYSPEVRAALDGAQSRFDRRMAIGVFREVAFNPVTVGPPAVPSTVVLSDDSPAVLPDDLATRLQAAGWDVRRIPGVHHDMHLEDPDRTFATIADLL